MLEIIVASEVSCWKVLNPLRLSASSAICLSCSKSPRDERGKAIPEGCYLLKIKSARRYAPAEGFVGLSANLPDRHT